DDRGCAISRGVRRPHAEIRDVDDRTSGLIERDKSLRTLSIGTPGRNGRGHDNSVSIDDWRSHPPALCREYPELFGKGFRPQQLPIRSQGKNKSACAGDVDISRVRISSRRSECALRGNILLKYVELVFPDYLACIGIQAHDPFLLARA